MSAALLGSACAAAVFAGADDLIAQMKEDEKGDAQFFAVDELK